MKSIVPKKAILGFTKKGAPIIDIGAFVSFLLEESKKLGENPSPEEVKASVIEIINAIGEGMKEKKKPIMVNKEPVAVKEDAFTRFIAKQMEENYIKALFVTHRGIPEC